MESRSKDKNKKIISGLALKNNSIMTTVSISDEEKEKNLKGILSNTKLKHKFEPEATKDSNNENIQK